MNSHTNEEQEYSRFMFKLAEKTKDLMSDYQELSLENQKRISDVCKTIVLTQGIAGVAKFVENPLNLGKSYDS